MSLLLLGGGEGSRMGGNKLFLSQDGAPLLAQLIGRLAPLFADIFLAVAAGEKEKILTAMPGLNTEYRVTLCEDRMPGRGPLEGLRNALAAMNTEWGFLYACDMPAPQEAVIRHQWSAVPHDSDVSCMRIDNHILALHAFYRKTCLPHIERALDAAEGQKRRGARIVSFYDQVRVQVLEEREISHLPGYKKSFENYNTPEELRMSLLNAELGGIDLGGTA
ncbi:molybdenum cofactor guanylyltransferase [Synergistaceae bacterium OttesenSCG-928-D05]|nr:molybdenum cofactor guanylyltransferase [Synergistaceae bacterium OttesenSCG-928-D05]